MQAVDTQVDSCTLTSLNNLVVKLFLNLCHNLFNTSGVDTAIANQLMESQTTYLTTNGVKTTDNDSLRCIVNNDFYTTGGLQCTDISTLTTNHTAFYVIIINMEYRYTVLDGSFSSYSLDGLNHNFLCLCIRIQLGLVHNLIHISCSIGTGLVLHGLYQAVLSFLCAQSREFLQLLALFLLHLTQFILLQCQCLFLIVNALLLVVKIVLTTSQLLLALVQ